MTGMPRPSNDRAAIEAEIDRVRSLDVDSLRTLWRTTFRSSPPPAFSKDKTSAAPPAKKVNHETAPGRFS
jgi:hypothetical protein